MNPPHLVASPYLKMQILFWGGYFVMNLVFMGLWGGNTPFLTLVFIGLSCMLGCASHGLRFLFKTYAIHWPLLKVCLQLLWLIPLSALAVQAVLTYLIFIIASLFPSIVAGAQPVSMGGLLGYTMNYAIMLTLWCILYLLRAEFQKRNRAEINHWQLQAQLKENELYFLKSQINSHFMFNAINNLRALINEDKEKAREGLANLSTLLRGLLQQNEQQLVTLRDELEWVQGYLSLETLQLEDKLKVVIDIDESLIMAQLPPLILQTLVENAIKHGIATRKTSGTLSIHIEKASTSTWTIKVTNPLPQLHNHTGNKIGLRNAKERLQKAFGNKAHLTLEMTDQVTAIVEMPL